MTPGSAIDSRRRSFYRKIAYVAAICVLLAPLFWLSHPATQGSQETKGRSGGKLAQLRKDHGLSQTQLGEVDLTSETIKLATLGMRGIAVQALWAKANTYQMKKDYTSLRATLEQISKLQPHFIAVWLHQSWNISFNVSVAFDDYRDKFYWIIEGIKYLQEGIKHNERESRLPREVGWFTSNKIGKADEALLHRRLFRKEPFFQEEGRGGLPPNPPPGLDRPYDNWQVGKAWFREAERVAEQYGISSAGLSRALFYSNAPLAQMYYAEALEKDGRFDEVALRAWVTAAREWRELGDRELPTIDGDIRLNELEGLNQTMADCAAKIDALAPGMRKKLYEEKLAALKPAERKVLETPVDQRTPEQSRLAVDAEMRVQVSNDEVANRAASSKRREARNLADDAKEADQRAAILRRERAKVNFEYWRLRAEMEQTPEAFAARKAIYEADRALADGRIVEARKAYEDGFQSWRKVIDRFPPLKTDGNLGYDLVQSVQRYRRALAQDEKSDLPQPFILQDILDEQAKRQQ